MKVVHRLRKKEVSGSSEGFAGFLLSNKVGGFLSLGIPSRYSGFMVNIGGKQLKILDNIGVRGVPNKIINNFWNVQQEKNGITETFFVPIHTNSMVYELEGIKPIVLEFDVKEAYDNREWGREYEVSEEDKAVLVTFTKKTDQREDASNNVEEYRVYVAVRPGGNLDYKQLNNWVKKEYLFDKERNSFPFERYVYEALEINSKRIVVSVASTKEKALAESRYVLDNLEKFKKVHKRYVEADLKDFTNDKVEFAYNCSVNSLDGLIMRNKKEWGVFAGLPWFFQVWSRDEAVSLKALMIEKEFALAKDILLKQLSMIDEKGRLPNRVPNSELESADSIGWHFKRWAEIIGMLYHKKLVNEYFYAEALHDIVNKLEKSLQKLESNYLKDGLIFNDSMETWMDTAHTPRKGACIEIQAMYLYMLRMLYELTRKKEYKEKEMRTLEKVRGEFWNNNWLADSAGDFTVRPNIFIAAYIYPNLLSKNEWVKCFDYALERLWLGYGGLSSIDVKDQRFCFNSTGENNKSYHNGDSWFWINNLAAIVLSRTDKTRYKDQISHILETSTREILFMGLLGHHSEISSASSLKPRGCLAQAWSSAMFIELVSELNKR